MFFSELAKFHSEKSLILPYYAFTTKELRVNEYEAVWRNNGELNIRLNVIPKVGNWELYSTTIKLILEGDEEFSTDDIISLLRSCKSMFYSSKEIIMSFALPKSKEVELKFEKRYQTLKLIVQVTYVVKRTFIGKVQQVIDDMLAIKVVVPSFSSPFKRPVHVKVDFSQYGCDTLLTWFLRNLTTN